MSDLKVVQIDPVTRKASISLNGIPQKVSGIDKLIQLVILAIYNSPGRDVFNPSIGSGIPDLIGSNLVGEDATEAIALVTERIEKIKEEIFEDQNNLVRANLSERLQDLEVLSVESGSQIDEIIVKLRLVSEAGQITTIAI